MSGGVFAVSRELLDHPIFAKEPYTEAQAFIWLIGEAAWKTRRVRVGRAVVDLQRGQCAFATRFMATKWLWSEASVRRFLKKLKTDAMIDAQSDALMTRITICNYDKYQRVSLPDDALDEAVEDADMTQTRRKEKDRGIQDNTTLNDAREISFDELDSELKAAAGEAIDPTSYGILHVAVVRSWLAAGADLRLDVLPTIRAKCAAAKKQSIRSWAYFTQAVADALARRRAELPEGVVVLNRGKQNGPSLSAHARTLADRIEAIQRGEPLFAIGGHAGG